MTLSHFVSEISGELLVEDFVGTGLVPAQGLSDTEYRRRPYPFGFVNRMRSCHILRELIVSFL